MCLRLYDSISNRFRLSSRVRRVHHMGGGVKPFERPWPSTSTSTSCFYGPLPSPFSLPLPVSQSYKFGVVPLSYPLYLCHRRMSFYRMSPSWKGDLLSVRTVDVRLLCDVMAQDLPDWSRFQTYMEWSSEIETVMKRKRAVFD